MSDERETFHCSFGIRGITRSRTGKLAKMQIEISDELASKLMKALAGIGPKIYGPTLQWQEDKRP